MKKILISTGGSGGHVIPAITLLEHFEGKFDVYLTTDKRGSRFIKSNLFKFEIINVPNIYSNIFMLPINVLFFAYSIIKSLIYLKKNNIDILFSTGGYMSLPLCIASKILNINIFLFEPNMVIGRANKLILKFCKKIVLYQNNIIGLSDKYKEKVFLTLPLLRKEIYTLNKNLNTKISKPLKIIVLGGSQGAKFFDETIKDLITNLSKFHGIHVSQQIYDENKINELKKTYDELKVENYLFRYNDNLFKKLNSFDLAITRSGATAISELSYFNIPFIAIPFPHAMDDHQFYNAKYYYDQNCCWTFNQNEFDLQKVVVFIKNLIDNPIDYFEKKKNLNNISYQNSWNNINQKLIKLLDEN